MNIKETAKHYKIAYQSLRRWIHLGWLPAPRKGKSRIVNTEILEYYIADRKAFCDKYKLNKL